MERNMDLARSILLEIEKYPTHSGWMRVSVEGFSPEEISYHVKLLTDAGLVESTKYAAGNETPEYIPVNMTWAGHEFLDAARNDSRWNKAKKIMKEKGGGIVFEVLKSLLIELTKADVLGYLKGS
jgi:DNA-binding HxlR family transcriptional regulator